VCKISVVNFFGMAVSMNKEVSLSHISCIFNCFARSWAGAKVSRITVLFWLLMFRKLLFILIVLTFLSFFVFFLVPGV